MRPSPFASDRPRTRRLLAWLDAAPIDDQLDRRNARIVQVLLLFLATMIPLQFAVGMTLSWSRLVAQTNPPAFYVSLALTLLIAVVAWVCLWLIRRGRFRFAVGTLLGTFLGMLLANAVLSGLAALMHDQLAQLLALVMAGLVLGRRALWRVFAVLVVVVLIGGAHDAFADDEGLQTAVNVPPILLTYLLVAVLIDHTSETLRRSLRESTARGEALEQEIRERERTHAQLIHAQKREITERMASGMAHDFNNIFSVIAGFAAERHEDDGGSDAQRAAQLERSLASVEASARRGMAVSRRLLRFSRRDDTQTEVFDAGEAVDALQPMLRQLLDARIVLQVERDAAPLPILFDRSQFELMLLNLASNARDAIEASGTFRIEAYRDTETVVVAAHDDGAGMTPDVAARVFEPFFSTKPADSGTGLGLAVVHELVTKAGGGIAVRSAPGAGTTFRIALPLSPPA